MNIPTVDQAKFCPACLSPAVEYGTIIAEQAPAKCTVCGWSGRKSELLTTTFVHEMGNAEETLKQFVNDFRNLMAKDCGVIIGRWLMRWGFLPRDPKEASKVLAKYMTNISKAAISAVIKTREDIAKESVHGAAPKPA